MLLCTEDISPAAQNVLAADGWDVRLVPTISNPGRWSRPAPRQAAKYPAHFWAVYTKLHIFNLVEYERGIHLPTSHIRHDICIHNPICLSAPLAFIRKLKGPAEKDAITRHHVQPCCSRSVAENNAVLGQCSGSSGEVLRLQWCTWMRTPW